MEGLRFRFLVEVGERKAPRCCPLAHAHAGWFLHVPDRGSNRNLGFLGRRSNPLGGRPGLHLAPRRLGVLGCAGRSLRASLCLFSPQNRLRGCTARSRAEGCGGADHGAEGGTGVSQGLVGPGLGHLLVHLTNVMRTGHRRASAPAPRGGPSPGWAPLGPGSQWERQEEAWSFKRLH